MVSTPISVSNTGKLKKLAEFERSVTAVALSANNRHVACGAAENTGFILRIHDNPIEMDGSVTLLDYLDMKPVVRFPTGRQGEYVFRLEYDSNGQYLACTAGDSLYVWDLERQDLVLKRPGNWMQVMHSDLRFVENQQGSKLLLALGNKVQVLDTNRWHIVDEWQCWQGIKVQSQVLAPDASRVGTINSDEKLAAVWNLRTGRLEWSHQMAESHISGSRALCFHPSGTLLAVGETGRITIWRLPQGKLASELRFQRSLDAQALAFSPNGKLLVAGLLQLEASQDHNGDWEVGASNLCTLWDWEWGTQLA